MATELSARDGGDGGVVAEDVTQHILELQAENLAFSTEIRSLQRRLAEVRSRRKPSPSSAQTVHRSAASAQSSRAGEAAPVAGAATAAPAEVTTKEVTSIAKAIAVAGGDSVERRLTTDAPGSATAANSAVPVSATPHPLVAPPAIAPTAASPPAVVQPRQASASARRPETTAATAASTAAAAALVAPTVTEPTVASARDAALQSASARGASRRLCAAGFQPSEAPAAPAAQEAPAARARSWAAAASLVADTTIPAPAPTPAAVPPPLSAVSSATLASPLELPTVPPLPAASTEPACTEVGKDRGNDELKCENNWLTEQLVEASMESAQNFESFSNDRNALWSATQDLRNRVQTEQAERQRCSTLLASTQEAMERLAAENLQMAEDLMCSRSGERRAETFIKVEPVSNTDGPLTDKTIDVLWTVHRREKARLTAEVQQRSQECEKLRRFVQQQATQANATILEMARRNLELEEKLRQACRCLEEHSLSPPSPLATGGASLSSASVAVPTMERYPPSPRPEASPSAAWLSDSLERRSSSVPPGIGRSVNSYAGRASLESNERGSIKTATAAATAATQAADTATKAANAAAAAAAAAAQSERFARTEWRARLVKDPEAEIEGLVQSPLAATDTSRTLSAPLRLSLDSQRSTKGLETPPSDAGRLGQRRKAETPPVRGASKTNLAAATDHQGATQVRTSRWQWDKPLVEPAAPSHSSSSAKAGEERVSGLSKLAEIREVCKEAREACRLEAVHERNRQSPRPKTDAKADGLGFTAPLGLVASSASSLEATALRAPGTPGELAEMSPDQRGSPPRSPFVGIDARYTGRGVVAQSGNHRSSRPSSGGSSGRRTDRLQKDLDIMSAEMRRVQQRSLLAAQ